MNNLKNVYILKKKIFQNNFIFYIKATLLRYKTQVSSLILQDDRCVARYGSSFVDINSAICAGENLDNFGPCKVRILIMMFISIS